MNNQIKEEGLTDAYLLGKYDGIKQGRAEVIDKIENLRIQYVDACNMCTKMECDVCSISNIIEDLEQLKEQNNG